MDGSQTPNSQTPESNSDQTAASPAANSTGHMYSPPGHHPGVVTCPLSSIQHGSVLCLVSNLHHILLPAALLFRLLDHS